MALLSPPEGGNGQGELAVGLVQRHAAEAEPALQREQVAAAGQLGIGLGQVGWREHRLPQQQLHLKPLLLGGGGIGHRPKGRQCHGTIMGMSWVSPMQGGGAGFRRLWEATPELQHV